MQENIRRYDTLKNEASVLRERIDLLLKINHSYDEFLKHKESEKLYSFLIDRSALEIKENEIIKTKSKAEQYKNEIADLDEALAKAEGEQKQLQIERDNLKLQLDSSENARRLEELQKQLERKLEYRKELKDEYEWSTALLHRTINSWVFSITAVNIKTAELDLNVIEPALNSRIEDILATGEKLKKGAEFLLNSYKEEKTRPNINEVNAISVEADNYRDLNKSFYERLSDAQSQCAQKQVLLRKEKESLEKGIYQFPKDAVELKEAIESRLRLRFGLEAKAPLIAEEAEVKNDKWRNVIEGYLNTQKFYVVVAPEHFNTAFQVYESIKGQKTVYVTGLVDTEKLTLGEPVRGQGSLAEELDTENQMIRLFVDYTLGNIQKCDSVRELRRHKASVTDDGVLYENFAVRIINPELWRSPAIGKGGAKLRLEAINAELIKLSQELLIYAALLSVLQKTEQFSRLSTHDIERIISAKNDYLDLPSLEKVIERLKADIESIDRSEIETLLNRLKERERDIDGIRSKLRKLEGDKGGIKKDLQICNEVTLPKLEEEAHLHHEKLEAEYDNDWKTNTGEPRYNRELSARGNAEDINNAFPREQSRTQNLKTNAWDETRDFRRKYNDVYKMGYDINAPGNENYYQLWKDFSEIKLPEYEARIEDTRKKAFQQFQEDFLSRLQSNIFNAQRQINELNTAIRGASFGEDTYRFRIIAKPDYKRYYEMIADEMLLRDGYNLGSESFNSKYKEEIAELFALITNDSGAKNTSGYEDYEKRVQVFTDYKTYLDFDLEVIKPSGEVERLSKTIGKKSGGETQTPFYIAVLASFVQMYRLGQEKNSNTARIILFDEAFSKMDGERIIQSIELLRKFDFQAILAAPPDKIPDIATLADRNLCVYREGRNIYVEPFDPRELEKFVNER